MSVTISFDSQLKKKKFCFVSCCRYLRSVRWSKNKLGIIGKSAEEQCNWQQHIFTSTTQFLLSLNKKHQCQSLVKIYYTSTVNVKELQQTFNKYLRRTKFFVCVSVDLMELVSKLLYWLCCLSFNTDIALCLLMLVIQTTS